MSFPNIPNITPDININREQVINLLLASIGMEELALAHIINAEGEKIQRALGTIPGFTPLAITISDLLTINQSVSKTLQDVIKKEMLLQFKLQNVLELIPSGPCTPQTQTFLPTGQGRFGSLQTFTVPEGVCNLSIRAIGAVGGTGASNGAILGGVGGAGASIQGEFSVTPGETLSILVGQRGINGNPPNGGGGGGGGSFVWRGNGFASLNIDSLLVAAGGGGGGGDADETPGNPGVNATIPILPSTSSNGTAGNPGAAGGVGGNGGTGEIGSGGAGILTSGENGFNGATGGQAIQDGGNGGENDINNFGGVGGFGGGGGAEQAGAGGGGFNGGGGGDTIGAAGDGGGGGAGSFNSGTSQINTAGVGTGDGLVVITTICC
jgi:hypothetical protein